MDGTDDAVRVVHLVVARRQIRHDRADTGEHDLVALQHRSAAECSFEAENEFGFASIDRRSRGAREKVEVLFGELARDIDIFRSDRVAREQNTPAALQFRKIGG
jgi:hypothetical protein